MPKFKTLKEFLDWVAHGKLLVDIVLAIAGMKGIKALIATFTHIPPAWASFIEWGGAAVILLALLRFTGEWRRLEKPSPQNLNSNAMMRSLPSNPGTFDSVEFFRTAYYSTLQDTGANSIKTEAERVRPHDKESFYLDVIAVGSIQIIYDQIWWVLYRSQLRALLELNRNNGLLPLSSFRKHYDEAAAEFSEVYTKANKTFDEWMQYMTDAILLKIHPSEMVEITVKGKDFLKYLLHWGRQRILSGCKSLVLQHRCIDQFRHRVTE